MPSRYGLVVEVTAGGRTLVFRGSPDPAGVHQGRVAVALAGLGVSPTVHQFIETPTGTWTILDRVFSGTPLGDMDPTDNPYSPPEPFSRLVCQKLAEFTYRKKNGLGRPEYRGLFLFDEKNQARATAPALATA